MAVRKRGLSQAEKRRREKEAKRREREKEAAARRREKLRKQELERKRRARERDKIRRERDKLARKIKAAQKKASEQQRKLVAMKRRGDAIRAAVLRAADRRLEKAREELAHAQAALLRTRPRKPGKREAFESELDLARRGDHPQQEALRNAFDMYLDLRNGGEIKGGTGQMVREVDLESSRHGAILEYRIPVGDMLDEATITEAVHRAERALAEMKKWHKYVYTNIHLYQNEPTYDTSTDKGKRGASPDGWIKERGPNDKDDLWSTWQGIPTMEIGPQVSNMIQSKLEGVVDAQGKRTVSILHEIVIRSMTEEELGRYRKRRSE